MKLVVRFLFATPPARLTRSFQICLITVADAANSIFDMQYIYHSLVDHYSPFFRSDLCLGLLLMFSEQTIPLLSKRPIGVRALRIFQSLDFVLLFFGHDSV